MKLYADWKKTFALRCAVRGRPNAVLCGTRWSVENFTLRCAARQRTAARCRTCWSLVAIDQRSAEFRRWILSYRSQSTDFRLFDGLSSDKSSTRELTLQCRRLVCRSIILWHWSTWWRLLGNNVVLHSRIYQHAWYSWSIEILCWSKWYRWFGQVEKTCFRRHSISLSSNNRHTSCSTLHVRACVARNIHDCIFGPKRSKIYDYFYFLVSSIRWASCGSDKFDEALRPVVYGQENMFSCSRREVNLLHYLCKCRSELISQHALGERQLKNEVVSNCPSTVSLSVAKEEQNSKSPLKSPSSSTSSSDSCPESGKDLIQGLTAEDVIKWVRQTMFHPLAETWFIHNVDGKELLEMSKTGHLTVTFVLSSPLTLRR